MPTVPPVSIVVAWSDGRECRFGAFSRSVVLPKGLDADSADASFENGVLTLRIHKVGKVKPKIIVADSS